ncbi:MAG TPA: glycerol-3-phosphate responsive antiterminator [Armatimonadota bacterium]|nr:glycerol-3-phosphate responsive antiterminator [Armatimonadota bacterium]
MDLALVLQRHPIIAAVRDKKDYKIALASRVKVIILLTGELVELKALVAAAKAHDKMLFLHMDFIAGLANDASAMRFLAEDIKPDGIVSTRNHLIASAQKMGLLTIQRFFLLDTQAVRNAISAASSPGLGAVEVLPGIIPRVIKKLAADIHVPLITGGLIETKDDIRQALQAGAMAVSMSRKVFWNVDVSELVHTVEKDLTVVHPTIRPQRG